MKACSIVFWFIVYLSLEDVMSRRLKIYKTLQNKAARIVTHSPLRAHRKDMYNKLGWLTVKQLVIYHSLLTVYRVRQAK